LALDREALWAKVDMTQIQRAIARKLTVFADATVLLLEDWQLVPVPEINSDRDPCLVAVRRNRYPAMLSISG